MCFPLRRLPGRGRRMTKHGYPDLSPPFLFLSPSLFLYDFIIVCEKRDPYPSGSYRHPAKPLPGQNASKGKHHNHPPPRSTTASMISWRRQAGLSDQAFLITARSGVSRSIALEVTRVQWSIGVHHGIPPPALCDLFRRFHEFQFLHSTGPSRELDEDYKILQVHIDQQEQQLKNESLPCGWRFFRILVDAAPEADLGR